MDSEDRQPCPNRECQHKTYESHTCPYKESVNDDTESLCHCWENCKQQCAEEI
ncbi:hypothetical protein KoPa5_00076 [Pseudomonas phage vB_PpuM-KoPa-5]